MRALIRSDNGADHARLLEVTVTADGVSYQVVAERPGYELDEFVVSDDLSTVAMLWNINGAVNYRSSNTPTTRSHDPIPLPGMVATELTHQRGRVDGGDDGRGPVDSRAPSNSSTRAPGNGSASTANPAADRVSAAPTLETITARDGMDVHRVAVTGPRPVSSSIGAMIYPARRSRRSGHGPVTTSSSRRCSRRASRCFLPNVRGSGGFGRSFMHADDREKRFAAIDDVADCVRCFWSTAVWRPADRIACAVGHTAAT